MEKIRREIKLFWTRNGKSLLQIIGFIAIVILIIQALNKYTILKNEYENSKIDYEQIEKEKIQKRNEKEDKDFIVSFVDYCNNKDVKKAYDMLSEECKQTKYSTIEQFEQKYLNKVFNNKKDCEIVLQQNNIYKIIFLKDILQSGALENRDDLQDYYTIKEDVLGNKTININLYNNI